jgi:hypothetical protein
MTGILGSINEEDEGEDVLYRSPGITIFLSSQIEK